MFFGWLWKSCGLRICKQHTRKSGCTQLNHCTSATAKKTPCEVQFQKGVIAQNLILYGPFILIGIIFLNWANTAYGRGYFGTIRSTTRYKMTKDPLTNYIYLDPLENHESTVIFLHGLQQSSSTQFDKVVNSDMFPRSTRIILAQAENGPVTTYGGGNWNRWFDIYIYA